MVAAAAVAAVAAAAVAAVVAVVAAVAAVAAVAVADRLVEAKELKIPRPDTSNLHDC